MLKDHDHYHDHVHVIIILYLMVLNNNILMQTLSQQSRPRPGKVGAKFSSARRSVKYWQGLSLLTHTAVGPGTGMHRKYVQHLLIIGTVYTTIDSISWSIRK